MRLVFAPLAVAILIAPLAAQAVTLTNKDGKSHDVTIKCSSTAQSSIGANSTRDIGKGPCTVTVKGSGARATAQGSAKLVIKNGAISVQ